MLTIPKFRLKKLAGIRVKVPKSLQSIALLCLAVTCFYLLINSILLLCETQKTPAQTAHLSQSRLNQS